jgi:hypothetical protein
MEPAMQQSTAAALPETGPVVSPDDSNRCQYRYANNKRCRLPGSKTHLGFCPRHFHLSSHCISPPPFNDAEDLSADLLPELSRCNSAVNLKLFLALLLALVTKGRISPRRAAVLSYLASQLIHSHNAPRPTRD